MLWANQIRLIRYISVEKSALSRAMGKDNDTYNNLTVYTQAYTNLRVKVSTNSIYFTHHTCLRW